MSSDEIHLRRLRESEWDDVARLIYESTNAWYAKKLNAQIFSGEPLVARVFPEVYEALDPGCCIVAEDMKTGKLVGSCFYHPRETHVSLGIMNVDAEHGGRGIAGKILSEIIAIAEERNQPVRLVSSAMNLDSYSLYTRAGFVPRTAFQDMLFKVPEEGIQFDVPGLDRVRPATPDDAKAMADLEMELCHIRREKDYRHFIENAAGIWHASVIEAEDGAIDGFLCSVYHPGSNLLGPGVARTEADTATLIHEEFNAHRGRSPVFLVPVQAAELVRTLYDWGARNCELHFAQVRGDYEAFEGVMMPTFMPETA